MVDSILFDRAVGVLNQALNISSERNRLIDSNIANVDTVGYTPKDLDFKKTLLKAMEGPSELPLAHTNPKDFEYGAGAGSADTPVYRNGETASVDIDTEMTHLAENNLSYRTSSEMLIRKLDMIKFSIMEGGS